MNAYHFLGGGNFLAVSHLQFGMRRDDQCQGAGDDYGYYGYYGYLECAETTRAKVFMVINMDVTHNVLDYTSDHFYRKERNARRNTAKRWRMKRASSGSDQINSFSKIVFL